MVIVHGKRCWSIESIWKDTSLAHRFQRIFACRKPKTRMEGIHSKIAAQRRYCRSDKSIKPHGLAGNLVKVRQNWSSATRLEAVSRTANWRGETQSSGWILACSLEKVVRGGELTDGLAEDSFRYRCGDSVGRAHLSTTLGLEIVAFEGANGYRSQILHKKLNLSSYSERRQ